VSPAALDGLDEYSHLWVIFVFDENTNACSEKGVSKEARTFPAKVAPPQLLGKKTGLFSTRTPHRPCPIGLSVARIVSVDKAARSIVIAGIDLVHGTPVLDVKPYIPAYDSIPAAACATWIHEGGAPTLNVCLSPAAELQSREIALPPTSMYRTMDMLLVALREVLQLDIRSTHQGRGAASAKSDTPYEMHFDVLRVRFTTEQGCVTVVDLVVDDIRKDRYRETRAPLVAESCDAPQ
jgi:tRNA-Thr(GGU) m(6)t(6)A37 methyltransferase TsaA